MKAILIGFLTGSTVYDLIYNFNISTVIELFVLVALMYLELFKEDE